MSFLESKDVRIYYEVYGDGEPVVLLNGIFMSTASWLFQRNHLVKLGYRIVLHDMRGQWNSSKPEDERQYSLEAHAEDLKTLLDYLGLKKVHLVGTSYGGEVAMLFAVKYREYVNDLTIITSVSEIHEDLRLTATRWLKGALSLDVEKFVLSWVSDVYSERFICKHGVGLVSRLIDTFSRGFSLTSAAYLIKSFLKLLDTPLTPMLKKIEVPALVISAEEDRVKPPKYSKIIVREIPKSTYVEIREAGHAVILEKPDVINYLVTGFIYSNPITTG
ncbi:MAG: alpha/beta hydrolase [Sulfolobales archaeon]|nr:alpha/beta hydrolase [Sulfolobales archaeon]MDW8083455.1 alpha/beta hydrolase [Sulfolobales archaeon]